MANLAPLFASDSTATYAFGGCTRVALLTADRIWRLTGPTPLHVDMRIAMAEPGGTHTLTIKQDWDSATVMTMARTSGGIYSAILVWHVDGYIAVFDALVMP